MVRHLALSDNNISLQNIAQKIDTRWKIQGSFRFCLCFVLSPSPFISLSTCVCRCVSLYFFASVSPHLSVSPCLSVSVHMCLSLLPRFSLSLCLFLSHCLCAYVSLFASFLSLSPSLPLPPFLPTCVCMCLSLLPHSLSVSFSPSLHLCLSLHNPSPQCLVNWITV